MCKGMGIKAENMHNLDKAKLADENSTFYTSMISVTFFFFLIGKHFNNLKSTDLMY